MLEFLCQDNTKPVRASICLDDELLAPIGVVQDHPLGFHLRLKPFELLQGFLVQLGPSVWDIVLRQRTQRRRVGGVVFDEVPLIPSHAQESLNRSPVQGLWEGPNGHYLLRVRLLHVTIDDKA